MELPQNPSQLKRPELQKLCKKLGLRANGKNVALVRSLEEYRDREEERVNVGQEEGEKKVEEEEEERETEVLVIEEGGDQDILIISDAECNSLRGERRRRKTVKARKGCTTKGGVRGKRRRRKEAEEKEVTPLPAEETKPPTPGKMERVSTEEGRGEERGGGGGNVEATTVQEDDTAVSMDTDELGTSEFKGAKINTRESKDITVTTKIVHFENKSQGGGSNIQQEEPPNVIPNSNDKICSEVVHDIQSGASNDTQEEPERETTPSSVIDVQEPQPLTISPCAGKKRRRETYSLSPHLLSSSNSLFDMEGDPKVRCRDTFSLSPPARDIFSLTPHPPPFPLSSNNSLTDKENDPKRRRDTFSLSPPSVSGSALNRAFLSDAGIARQRRHTHSVSPNSSTLLGGGRGLVATSTTEKVGEEGGDMEACERSSQVESSSSNVSAAEQIMALLDKRVQERKADPTYVPPPSLLNKDGSLKRTHIPISLSKTTAKFNKSHRKSFKKMPSIVDYAEQKKRRLDQHKKLSTPAPPAKRQKVAPHTPASSSSSSTAKPLGACTKTVTKTAAHKFSISQDRRKTNITQSVADQKPQAKGPTVVKPVIRREPNTHFSGSADVLKPFQFTASSVTGVKKAASSALKTWEGERKSYKPYRGRLPTFEFPRF